MHGDLGRVTDHLVVGVDIRGAEVNEDVDDEHDVHHEVNHAERVTRVATLVPLLLLGVVEQEGSTVRSEDGRVNDQQQDEPVPHGLERAVVQDGELVDALRLQLVLRKHIGTQRQHLRKRQSFYVLNEVDWYMLLQENEVFYTSSEEQNIILFIHIKVLLILWNI